MTISIIAAISKNNIIGSEGNLPWHLSDDLKNFKRLTLNKPLIMGRKTFESIKKPLPNRINIIISRNKHYAVNNNDVIICDSMESAINKAREYEQEIMIIGGAQIYEQALNIADKMYLTIVDAIVDGDASFPTWNKNSWQLIDTENFSKNEKNDFDFVTNTYIRNDNRPIDARGK